MTIVDDLLPACTVRIDVRNTPAGTGFFVGRGLIVTCAHVVESPADPSQSIDADDIQAVLVPGNTSGATIEEVATSVDIRRFAPLPGSDLAVLKVRDPFDNRSVLLDSRSALARDELHTFGFPESKPRGVPRGIRAADGTGGDGRLGFSGAQIQPGMSGAPLLNRRTGSVCGVISITRDSTQDLGGYAIQIKPLLDLYPKIRGANGQANHGDSEWVRALSVEQRQGYQTRRAIESQSLGRSFTVTLGQTDDGWSVKAEEAGGRPVLEERVDFNAVKEEVARLFRDWASRGRVHESEQLRFLGGILFSAAFPCSVGSRLRELSTPGKDPVAVNLRFEAGINTRVIELPWEHLCIPEADELELYLATDERFGLARVLSHGPRASAPADLTEGLSVALVAVDGPESARECDAATDVVGRISRLSAEKFPGLLVRELDNPDADDLGDLLDETRPSVLHYVGLGRFSQRRDEIALGPSGSQHAPVEVLIDALPDPPPRLVILQMVNSPPSNVVPADFSLFAPGLIEHGVEAVLAYQYPVEKSTTNRFNKELYTQLLAGHSLELATQKSRRAIRHYGNGRSFVSPAIFLADLGPLPLCLPTAAVEPLPVNVRSPSFAAANV